MYVIYMDGPKRDVYACIHKDTCGHWTSREGDSMPTGEWTSGFKSVADAERYAKQHGIANPRLCGTCKP